MNTDQMWRALQEAWDRIRELERLNRANAHAARTQKVRAEHWRHRALEKARAKR